MIQNHISTITTVNTNWYRLYTEGVEHTSQYVTYMVTKLALLHKLVKRCMLVSTKPLDTMDSFGLTQSLEKWQRQPMLQEAERTTFTQL